MKCWNPYSPVLPGIKEYVQNSNQSRVMRSCATDVKNQRLDRIEATCLIHLMLLFKAKTSSQLRIRRQKKPPFCQCLNWPQGQWQLKCNDLEWALCLWHRKAQHPKVLSISATKHSAFNVTFTGETPCPLHTVYRQHVTLHRNFI